MELKGNIIKIRPIQVEDTDYIIKWRNRPSVKSQFIYQKDLTREEHLNWMQNMVATGKVAQFIIIDLETNAPIGSTFLRDIDTVHSKAEFGIFIGEGIMRGKGMGTDAIKLTSQYGFEHLKLNRIFLRILADNLASINSCRKAGFTQEGIFRKEVFVNGKFCDVLYMGMLKEEYQG